MLLNFAHLDLNEKGMLYIKLYEEIKSAVSNGILKKGERLPSVREAATQLGVSRTTVENAYTKLCIEGIIESKPQKGYFVIGIPETSPKTTLAPTPKTVIAYDFSSRSVDSENSDTELWKKLVRSVLWDSGELNSYGDPQGELGLRKALSDYSYKARGVTTTAENIIVGAGVGPLLNILCGLLGRKIKVGFERDFKEAQQIFDSYGIENFALDTDKNGVTEESLTKNQPDVLFLLPSSLSKISPTSISVRRNFIRDWAKKNDCLIIEDDYNGELRYTARSVPAFQQKSPQNTIYIGSFSKLLLPSVRIAYMVLPDFLAKKLHNGSYIYNQTCGKIEQLALEKYIVTGALEKHLKRLRRVYYNKSQLLINELKRNFNNIKSISLFESSLTIEIEFLQDINEDITKTLLENGVKIANIKNLNTISLCFSGIPLEKIPDGIKWLKKFL